MPLVGTRELSAFEGGPLVTEMAGDKWELAGSGILQLMYEVDGAAVTSLLPPALHPTVPPTVIFTVTNVPDSPAGPFVLAEAKVGCRSGARPRGLSLGAYCNSPEAVAVLSSRWGYPLKLAECSLTKRYDRIQGTVESAGRVILDMTLLNPEPISGQDLLYLSVLNTARITRDGEELPRLVQVDPDFVFRSADRGKPMLETFDAPAFGLAEAKPVHAVSASYAVADIAMPELRYLVDPSQPPLKAVERL
jgi:hypothetical protein